jgi:hypothetical protein
MRVASVHSQAENDAIGQFIGPTDTAAYLGGERLADKSWRWRDGTPWDFEAWELGQPSAHDDDEKFLTIKWQPGFGVAWVSLGDGRGVVCEAASISAIRGVVPTILQLGGPKNSALIAASEDL